MEVGVKRSIKKESQLKMEAGWELRTGRNEGVDLRGNVLSSISGRTNPDRSRRSLGVASYD